jgi:hypothetical protein
VLFFIIIVASITTAVGNVGDHVVSSASSPNSAAAAG